MWALKLKNDKVSPVTSEQQIKTESNSSLEKREKAREKLRKRYETRSKKLRRRKKFKEVTFSEAGLK